MSFDSVFTSILQYLAYGLGIVFILGVIGGVWLWLRKEFMYQYKVTVVDLTSTGAFRLLPDKGGVFVDRKTKRKMFWLKKEKGGLSPDHIPFIISGKSKAVFVLKRGTKSFSYIIPTVVERFITKVVPVLNAGQPVFKDGVQLFEDKQIKENFLDFNVGDEDINWAINTYDKNKIMFTQTTFMQLLPFIALAFVGIVICIIFIYFFKKLDVLADMANSFKLAAVELAKGQAGTVVIAGG